MNRTAKVLLASAAALGAAVIVGSVLLAFSLRGRAGELVRAELNRRLDATVDFASLDLSLLASFPRLSVVIEQLEVVGKGEFEGRKLLRAESVRAGADLFALLGDDEMHVESVVVERALVDLVVTLEGQANYDIFEETDESSQTAPSASFRIEEYEIIGAEVLYEAPGIGISVNRLDHRGSVKFTGPKQEWVADTTAAGVTAALAGLSYLKDARIKADVEAAVDTERQSLRLGRLGIAVNELPIDGNGAITWTDDTVNLDLAFSSPEATPVKSLISAIPNAYAADFTGLQAGGSFSFDGSIQGALGPEDDVPPFEIAVQLDDGRLKYPDLPLPITDLNLDAKITHPGGPLNKTTITVSRYSFVAGKSHASGRLSLATVFARPRIDLRMDGRFDLAEIAQAYPIGDDETRGVFEADVELLAQGDVLKKLTGSVNVTDVTYRSDVLPEVHVASAKATLTPTSTRIDELVATTGSSDLSVTGTLSPVTTLLADDEKVAGVLALKSGKLVVEDFAGDGAGDSSGAKIPADIDLRIKADIAELVYEDTSLSDVTGSAVIKDQTITLKQVSAKSLGGVLKVDGTVATPDDAASSFDLRYKLKDAKFQEAFAALNSFKRLAPITQFLSGRFSTGLKMKGNLGQDMMPDLATLGGGGFLEAVDSTLEDFRPLQVLSEALPTIPPKFDFRKVKTRFAIENGAVNVREFPVTVKGVPLRISGSHGLDQQMKYFVKVQVPMKELEASAVAKKVKAMGLDVGRATKLDVTARVTGTIKSPWVELDIDAPELQQVVEEAVEEKVDEGRDTAKEELSKQAEKLLADAQKRADQIRAEARRAAAKIRKEGKAKAARIEKQGGDNPLKQFAAKQSADALRRESRKSASQLVKEADQRADQVMREAQNQAARLR